MSESPWERHYEDPDLGLIWDVLPLGASAAGDVLELHLEIADGTDGEPATATASLLSHPADDWRCKSHGKAEAPYVGLLTAKKWACFELAKAVPEGQWAGVPEALERAREEAARRLREVSP